MKGLEKAKIQRTLNKILSGVFDENDVDSLFNNLREYCDGHRVFREVGDSLAHKNIRDRGISQEHIHGFFLSLQYHIDYGSRIKVDPEKPFPKWVKDHMEFQVDKCDPNDLDREFNIKPEDLKSHIKRLFKVDENTQTAALRKPLIRKESKRMIQHILGFINLDPLFTADDLIKDLVGVLHQNELSFDENTIITHRATIVICVMLLMHHTEFEVIKDRPFKGYIMSDTHENLTVSVPIEQSSFWGQAKGQMTVWLPLFTSNLNVHEFCEKDLLDVVERMEGSQIYFLFKQELRLTQNFKLGLL